MAKLPESYQDWLEYLDEASDIFSQYQKIKKENTYLIGLKNKDPKKFKKFKGLVNDLVNSAAFISNNKSNISGSIEHGSPKNKQRDLRLILEVIMDVLPEVSKLQRKLAEI